MKKEEVQNSKSNRMVSLRTVSKHYPDGTIALRGVTFDVEPGDFISIVGRSGAGKSTLVRVLLAEERVTRGQVSIGGWDITDIASRDVANLRRQIGVVFQDYKLLPRKTVLENVAFALEVCGIPSRRINEVVPQMLKLVGLEGKRHQFPEQLSGGEQQRVSIARALVHQPRLLIADEPTGNLDTINTQEIIELLRKINQLGTTVLLVTHNRDVVNALKRRVITLDGGAVVSDQSVGRYVL
jgi:cell division transport system ATP-binding protein